MKKILALVLASLMLFAAVACSTPAPAATDTPAANSGSAGTNAQPETKAESNASTENTQPATGGEEATAVIDAPTEENLKTVYDDSKYASMTVEELYQEALKEGGTLVVYSETSSTGKSKENFQKLFPGIEVEISKYKNYDINAKVPLEYDANQPYCDLVIAGDSDGVKYNEWYDAGYVVSYIPAEMKDDLYQDYLVYGLPITIEGDVWWYSKNMYPDGCPINNWWDIIEKDEATGEYKYHLYMHDVSNNTTAGMLCNLVYRSDELAAAYKEKYGKDLEYTYPQDFGVEENNAGYEWLYRYLQSNYTVITDSDEILATIDRSTEPSLGFATSLKYGDTKEAGENVFFCLGMNPCTGFAKVKYVYICTKSDNPAAARLFAIYSLGNVDGQGEGYPYYVNRNGCYGVRYSHDDSTHSEVSLTDLNIYPSNIGYVYENVQDVIDFWTYFADALKK